ncbi:hypothetical protein ACFYNO_39725 [Kitasatospora sp. NPDC006697]
MGDRPGEPVSGLLRPGNAGSNTAADHIEAAGTALPGYRGSTCRSRAA